MKIYHIIPLLILLISPVAGLCQTGLDTAAVLTGTAKRAIPVSDPIRPSAPETFKPARVPKPSAKNVHEAEKEKETTKRDLTPAASSALDPSDSTVSKAFQASQVSYYAAIEKRNLNNKIINDSVRSYYLWALQNRKLIISRQQCTGNLIFILVVTLVLSGLIFSGIQFYIALKSLKKRSGGANTATSFKASLSGIEVSSSVLGVIVLTISIVFFYLYLSRVYPLVSLDQIPVQLPEIK
ncbi:hypothetical protein SAMN05192574_105337 [Mucilaginibacter gossypiicola]|uniref:Uncharacterized protein n=1 Tax=Mucilaginibacter gossypiicola TaxID=551995 RepID=A0A1H8M0M3_9SPHI|nr:hypothetical protein [Mucilaginibacter gossypiicola]SEO10942.1 hypothetical protein SAMN05192574_105337 [Mucilaginibacter gossypiicola]